MQEMDDTTTGRDPIEVLQNSPLQVEELLATFGPSDLASSYAPGKWTANEILAHLADVELAYAFRFRLILGDDQPVLQPFDQDQWARRYFKADAALAVGAYRSVRSWNLALLTTLDLDDWLRQGYHPEHGLMSIDEMVRRLAEHDLNHLAQLQRIAGGL